MQTDPFLLFVQWQHQGVHRIHLGGCQCQQILSVLYHTILLLLCCIVPSSTDILLNSLIFRRKKKPKKQQQSKLFLS